MDVAKSALIAGLSVVGVGVVFVMIYWLSLLLFPAIILTVIGALVFLSNVKPKEEHKPHAPYKYDED